MPGGSEAGEPAELVREGEALVPWCKCGHYITLTQANLSSMRNDSHEPACKDCVTAELTKARNEALNYTDNIARGVARRQCDHKFVDSGHCLKCGWRP